jgi:hypothetical protein
MEWYELELSEPVGVESDVANASVSTLIHACTAPDGNAARLLLFSGLACSSTLQMETVISSEMYVIF